MRLSLHASKTPPKGSHIIHLVKKSKAVKGGSAALNSALASGVQAENTLIHYAEDGEVHTIATAELKLNEASSREALRNVGHRALTWLNGQKITSASVVNHTGEPEALVLFAEGLALGSYQFLELFTDPAKRAHSLKKLTLVDAALDKSAFAHFKALTEAVFTARDLVNRPLSHLNAEKLAAAVKEAGERHGFKVEVLNKQKITSLKMGGLLAVNKGSIDPPTFTIAEYKPSKPVNSAPVVLVGKGVVYDTGGMSLKPTANSMDFMKSDMAGAATMIGCMTAVAAMKLPIHLIALIPATDNRPDGNAYVPGDVITMFDGTTVEVKNTDAEGRLLLADALAYAKKYKPTLVIDAATLTGASVRAIGTYATSLMGTAPEKVMANLEAAGYDTWERLVRFPLWDDYAEELKSDVADMSNLGKGEAGQISAGKFLQHFTDFPWVHLDIAGPSFLHSPSTYRTSGGTGVGVRLLVRFLERHFNL